MAASATRIASRRIGNSLFTVFCWAVTALALTALAAILWSLVSQGIGGVNPGLFIKSTPAARSPGGLANAIVGSLMMCITGLALAFLVGVVARARPRADCRGNALGYP